MQGLRSCRLFLFPHTLSTSGRLQCENLKPRKRTQLRGWSRWCGAYSITNTCLHMGHQIYSSSPTTTTTTTARVSIIFSEHVCVCFKKKNLKEAETEHMCVHAEKYVCVCMRASEKERRRHQNECSCWGFLFFFFFFFLLLWEALVPGGVLSYLIDAQRLQCQVPQTQWTSRRGPETPESCERAVLQMNGAWQPEIKQRLQRPAGSSSHKLAWANSCLPKISPRNALFWRAICGGMSAATVKIAHSITAWSAPTAPSTCVLNVNSFCLLFLHTRLC